MEIIRETKTLKAFRWIAIAEGISYLAFFITMPLKYMLEIKTPNKIIGMAHGLLFVVYVIYAYLVTEEQKWTMKRFAILFIASLIPFATFYIEKKYLRPTQS
jgi:integral membrane protein